MSAEDIAFFGYVYVGVRRRQEVARLCGASGIEQIYAVNVFGAAAMSVSEQHDLYIVALGERQKNVKRVFDLVMMSVSEHYPHAVLAVYVNVRSGGEYIAVAANAVYLLVGEKLSCFIKLTLSVTEKYVCVRRLLQYFPNCAAASVSIRKNYYAFYAARAHRQTVPFRN